MLTMTACNQKVCIETYILLTFTWTLMKPLLHKYVKINLSHRGIRPLVRFMLNGFPYKWDEAMNDNQIPQKQ